MAHIKTTLCYLALFVPIVITAQAQFTSGSGIVYTTNTTDKVGIGTTTPSAKLDVKGSGRFTDAVAATSGTGLELDYLIPSDYARVLAYDRTNNVYKSLKINGSVLTLNDISNGNVGIGTGTPGVKLEVKGSGRFTDAGAAPSGIGLELDYIVASDYGRILSYDRTNSVYKPLRLNGSSLFLNDMSKGNVSVGPVSIQGSLSAFQVHQSNVLGSIQGNFIDISTLSGTGGTANRLMSKLWVVRDNAGSDWTTARLHEGVTIDATYTTPMVDTRTWWERDPYNNIQSWGTGLNTYMTINTGNVGIGTSVPGEPLSVASNNPNTVSLLRNIAGGNILSGGTAGAILFGTFNTSSNAEYSGALIRARPIENWTPGTAHGSALTFEVAGSGTTTITERMRIDPIAVSIGSTTNKTNLNVEGDISIGGNALQWYPAGEGVKMRYDNNFFGANYDALVIDKTDVNSNEPDGGIAFVNTGMNGVSKPSLVITGKGNVLINKTSQVNSAYKLDIAGYVRADKLVVNTTGADFVFEPSYALPSLQSVETFIKKYHHLPGIASAGEMQNNGLDVGEYQTNLLQKTEELTLYAIEQDKKINEQAKEIEMLKKKQAALQDQNKKINQLESQVKALMEIIKKQRATNGY